MVGAGNDGQFRKLTQMLGKPELANDSRFKTNKDRVAHAPEMEAELRALPKDRDAKTFAGELMKGGVPSGAVLEVADVMEHPHTRHRGMVWEKDGCRNVGNPVKLSRTPPKYAASRRRSGWIPAPCSPSAAIRRPRSTRSSPRASRSLRSGRSEHVPARPAEGKAHPGDGGGTGLGRSMAQRYLELGANVIICGRREDVLKQTVEELHKDTGGEIEAVGCDVRVPGAVEAMMDTIWAKRPLDILVNNAAGQILAQTHKMSSRAIDAVLNIVLHGSAYCTVAAGRRWIDAGERNKVVMSILTVSSLTGAAFTVPSAMAKAGVLAMTKSLAVEWGPKGIPHLRDRARPLPDRGRVEPAAPKSVAGRRK